MKTMENVQKVYQQHMAKLEQKRKLAHAEGDGDEEDEDAEEASDDNDNGSNFTSESDGRSSKGDSQYEADTNHSEADGLSGLASADGDFHSEVEK
jgi:hypothetical protein